MEELIELTELQQVLADYARDAAEIYKYQLALGGKRASRKLIDSVRSNVEVDGNSYEVSLTLQDYWKYVEGGRKGKESSPPGAVCKAAFPPVDALVRWINIKPILPRPDQYGRIPSPETLAFLIGRKIEREGIEPHPALATTKEELERMYKGKLAAALGHDVERFIRKMTAAK